MSHEEYIRIKSDDGKNTVERVINQIEKKVSKGRVEFGVDIEIDRVTDEIESLQSADGDDTPGFDT